MSNLVIRSIAWIGLGLHLIAGLLALRSGGPRQLVPAMNFITAAGVIVYWGYQWFGYLFRGITWYASDQLIPLYAIVVCVLAGGTLANRFAATAANWLIFAAHTAAFVVAVLFVTFFRMKMF